MKNCGQLNNILKSINHHIKKTKFKHSMTFTFSIQFPPFGSCQISKCHFFFVLKSLEAYEIEKNLSFVFSLQLRKVCWFNFIFLPRQKITFDKRILFACEVDRKICLVIAVLADEWKDKLKIFTFMSEWFAF